MKSCPICKLVPYWHYARHTSAKTGNSFFILSGCNHIKKREFNSLVTESGRASIEDMWDKEMDGLFCNYTSGWSVFQKNSFRKKIWPEDIRQSLVKAAL